MNRRAKGLRAEREVAKFLEAQGYSVYRPSWNRWGAKDLFNRFDLLAFKTTKADPDTILGMWLYEGFTNDWPLIWLLQVKTHPTDYYKAKKQVRQWFYKHDVPAELAAGVILRKAKNYYRTWLLWNEQEHEWETDWRDGR